MKKISIIIPAFNEEKRIEKTIEALKKLEMIHEIIVIDDGSRDNTSEVARKYDVKVIRYEQNKGKGYALRKGLEACSGEIIVFLDADVQDTAVEVKKIIQPILNDDCDVCIAKFSKSIKKGGIGVVKLISRLGTKMLSGAYIESVLSGQRAFKREVLNDIKIEDGYGAEVGMTIDILRKGYIVKEIEVAMRHNETGRDLKGFIHRGKQAIHIINVLCWKMIRE